VLVLQVEEALTYMKLEKYSALFEREDVDMPTFLTLTDADLKAIAIDLLGELQQESELASSF